MKQKLFYTSCCILGIASGLVLGTMCTKDVEKQKVQTEKETQTIIIEKEKEKFPHKPLGKFELTFYTPTGNRTATGTKPKEGRTIAVDPKVIPYGSVVYVEGHGYFIAEDCGGAVNGKVIDIFVNMSNAEAKKLGRKQNIKVYKMEL